MAKGPELIGMAGDSLREAFGKALVRLGETNRDFVVLDADIAGGTGVHHFRRQYPNRFYQCGIAEQNMMAMSAGLASTGLPVFVTTFAVFCIRAIEQARLSLAYNFHNVNIVASHPGLDVGPDGASAQCLEDLAMFRAIPNMTVISPADPLEMALATEAVLEHKGPVYMRTGRSPSQRVLDASYRFRLGQASILRQGTDVTLVACGKMVAQALNAAEQLAESGVSARVVNMSTIKPIDEKTLVQCAAETGCFVTAEDHNTIGGLGGAVAETLARKYPVPIEFIGVNDCFGESGEPDELMEKYKLTAFFIVEAVKTVLKRKG